MHRSLLLAALLAAATWFSGFARINADGPRIGTIDTKRVFAEYHRTKDLEDKINAERQALKAKIDAAKDDAERAGLQAQAEAILKSHWNEYNALIMKDLSSEATRLASGSGLDAILDPSTKSDPIAERGLAVRGIVYLREGASTDVTQALLDALNAAYKPDSETPKQF